MVPAGPGGYFKIVVYVLLLGGGGGGGGGGCQLGVCVNGVTCHSSLIAEPYFM